MMTFKEAEETFATARDKSSGKPLGNNTRLVKYGNGYAVFLHKTAVVVIKVRLGSYNVRVLGTALRMLDLSCLKTGLWSTRLDRWLRRVRHESA